MKLTMICARKTSQYFHQNYSIKYSVNRQFSSGSSLQDEVKRLYQFLNGKRDVVVITGAGVSTASGIPDYRGENGSYRKGHKPMIHSDFMNYHSSRQRYWSRSMKGFRFLGDAKPNKAHIALRQLEQRGVIKHVITQNVDGLHSKAGTRNVLNIHGRIDEVKCMKCQSILSRDDFQSELESLNPNFVSNDTVNKEDKIRADGDIDIDSSIDLSQFVVPSCSVCTNNSSHKDNNAVAILKPNVVFFGDNVPRLASQAAMKIIENCDGVLIAGTTLEVYSVFRLVRTVFRAGIPLAIINKGETRIEREAPQLCAAGGLDEVKLEGKSANSPENQIEQIIQFRSNEDCGLVLSELSTYYQNI